MVLGLLQELGFKVSMILDDDPKMGNHDPSVPVRGRSNLVKRRYSRAILGSAKTGLGFR